MYYHFLFNKVLFCSIAVSTSRGYVNVSYSVVINEHYHHSHHYQHEQQQHITLHMSLLAMKCMKTQILRVTA